jgi:DNA-binding MarR family transcriptional regulator
MSALAEALCISRASLYRVLDSLEERNAICRNGRQIELVKGETL